MSEKVIDILKEVKVPIFNLYNQYVQISIVIDGRWELLKGDFNDYNSDYKLEILIRDTSIFLERLKDVKKADYLNDLSTDEYINDYMEDEVFNMMKFSAIRAKAIAYPDGLIEWARIVIQILEIKIKESNRLHFSFACNWLENLIKSYDNLNSYGWAYIAYCKIHKNIKPRKKLNTLNSFAEKWTNVKLTTFRRKYNKVETQEWRNSKAGKDYLSEIQPILSIWHI